MSKTDTSAAAVERLADVLANSYPYGGPTRTEIEEAAATLRALLARAERAEVERDAAQRLAEANTAALNDMTATQKRTAAERDALRDRLESLAHEYDKTRAMLRCEQESHIATGEARDLARQERDAARAERDRYAEREMHFARALRVADGGQYRHDWDAAIRRVVVDRDAARAEAARLREALQKIADDARYYCDHEPVAGWLPRMKDIRDTARAALAAKEPGHE